MTQEYLKSILTYDTSTGIFTWNKTGKGRRNKTAGTESDGYIHVTISGKRYRAHRLAFLYMTGINPSNQIDHINHKRNDNRWSNLREVTNDENRKNLARLDRNKSGVTGVHLSRRKNRKNKWIAKIVVKNKQIFLGQYVDFDDAVKARKKAEVKYGFHTNHGS